jgi:hypothetical protein
MHALTPDAKDNYIQLNCKEYFKEETSATRYDNQIIRLIMQANYRVLSTSDCDQLQSTSSRLIPHSNASAGGNFPSKHFPKVRSVPSSQRSGVLQVVYDESHSEIFRFVNVLRVTQTQIMRISRTKTITLDF